MSCGIVKKMLALHAGGDLPRAVEARVEGHVAHCAACARALAAHREDLGRLAAVGTEAEGDPLGDNFWYGIRRELRTAGLCGEGAADARRGRGGAGARAMIGRAVALAATVLLAAVLFFPKHTDENSLSPEGRGPGRGGSLPERETARAPLIPMAVLPPVADLTGDRGGLYIERVSAPAANRSAIEESQPFAPPGVQYHIEGWRANEADRETMSF